VAIEVDFFPALSQEEYENEMRERLLRYPDRTVSDFVLGMTHKRVNQAIIRKNGFRYDDKVADIGAVKLWALLMEYRKLRFKVAKAESIVNAQVCAGGVALKELSDELASAKVPGLYFAGEILDVDGRCGGYNLQWAWSSGYVAGESAAQG
jgi:predicted Rossmann fold flavoprotein